MKTVIFLGSKQSGSKNNAGVLAEQISKNIGSDYTTRRYFFEDLVFHISMEQRTVIVGLDGYDLKDADLVIAFNWYPSGKRSLRDIAFTIGLYLQEQTVPVWNSEVLQQRSTTKLSAMWLLARNNVLVPETYFSLNHEALQRIAPFEQAIVKDIATSRGRNNYLVRSKQELAEVLAKQPVTRFMVQEVIPNDYDVRLICFGGVPSLVLKRQRISNNTHLNNTSQGAQASLLPLESLPVSVRQQAANICKLMGRELAGIDYVVANDGSDRYICLEVNAIPQLTSGTYTTEKSMAFAAAIEHTLGKD